MSLKDAKNSPNWPEWEIAIQAELNLLKEKGTWELVHKPPDAIPITNKWIFIKKRDKEKLSGTEQDSWPKDVCNVLDTVIQRHVHQLSEWTLYAQF